MTTYDNNMQGVLFKNEKEGIDSRPDYRGSCEIKGVEYWVSMWVNKGRDGKPRMKLAFRDKLPPGTIKAPRAPKAAPDSEAAEAFTDQIPF